MGDFITAALPWVVIGLAAAFFCAARIKRKGEEYERNYMTVGMCIGMCIGTALGSTGIINLGLGISLGVLAGEIIGMNIREKN